LRGPFVPPLAVISPATAPISRLRLVGNVPGWLRAWGRPMPAPEPDRTVTPKERAFMSIAAVRESTHTPQTSRDGVETRFQYPGIPTTCDGAEAVVHVEVQISQAAGAYPITSSTTMGGGFNSFVMNGETNLFGDPLMFFEPESEHSAAAACAGFAAAGGRASN